MELDRDCCPFVSLAAWEPEKSSLTLHGRSSSVFLMRQDYPQIIISSPSITIWLHPKMTIIIEFTFSLVLICWFPSSFTAPPKQFEHASLCQSNIFANCECFACVPLIGHQMTSRPVVGCLRHSLSCRCLILIFS